MLGMRFRNMYMIFGTALVVLLWIISDPDLGAIKDLPFGSGAIAMLIFMSKGVIASTLLYVTRKGMMDYDTADFEELGKAAKFDPQGAGQYAIAVSIQTLAFAVVIVGAFFA